jgi:hypothetical protein
MPGSSTTPGCSDARAGAPAHVAFRRLNSVGAWDRVAFAAQWLACTLPCRRLADLLADVCARLGPMWFATPSSQWTCTIYSLPVSRRTQTPTASPAKPGGVSR